MTIKDLKTVCRKSITSIFLNGELIYVGRVRDIPQDAEMHKIISVEINNNIIGHELIIVIEENKESVYKASYELPDGHIVTTPYCKTKKEAQTLIQKIIDEFEKE